MGNYYADAFAAAAFARSSDSERARAALEHAKRTYHEYVPSPIWYHHEFKNAPMMEAWVEIGQPGDGSWLDRLHGDNYDPNNVMAVRLHWVALRMRLRPQQGDTRRLARARARLLAAQDKTGLFLDDRPPHHTGVADLAYHLFTLAFLARYLSEREDEEVSAAFLRGARLARALMVADGSVAHTGRGSNNVYQQAAAVLAFAWASRADPSFAEAARTAFGPVSRWQQQDGSWATCLNAHGAERMAWNHCATPYNALTTYFLGHAAEILDALKDSSDRDSLNSDVSATTAEVGMSPRFGRVAGSLDMVAAASFNGSVWSGMHGSGVAGTAALLSQGEHVFLSLDHLAEPDMQVTDLPEVIVDGNVVDWRTPSSVLQRDSGVTHCVTLDESEIRILIDVAGDEVTMSVELPRDRPVTVNARLPVVDGVAVSAPGVDVLCSPVPSNPRGRGLLMTWPVRVTYGKAVIRYRVLGRSVEVFADGLPLIDLSDA